MIVFITIGIIGFLLLVLALVFGELADHGAELAHDVAVEHEIDGAGDDVAHAGGGPSILSFRFIACGVTGFGCGGAIASYLGLGYLLSSLIGLGVAFVLAALLYVIVSFLYKQQASSNVTSADLVGKAGTVSIAIPAGGMGEVILNVKGRTVQQFAKVDGNTPLTVGAVVTVKAVVGDKVVVG